MSKRLLFIPDTQVKMGVPLHHIKAAAEAIVEYKPDIVVHIGDHWDNPALSKHEAPGSIHKEGTRILDDIEIGNEAFRLLDGPMAAESARLASNHRKRWDPDKHYFMGNHCFRVDRAVAEVPQFEGVLSSDMMKTPPGWQRHPFLKIVDIEGVWFSHYFSNTQSGRPIGGSIDNRLNKIGQSFAQGHQQGIYFGQRQFPGNIQRHGLVAGSFYLHDEHYRDAQSNGEWRGIIIMNELENGMYDIMPLSMKYILRRFG